MSKLLISFIYIYIFPKYIFSFCIYHVYIIGSLEYSKTRNDCFGVNGEGWGGSFQLEKYYSEKYSEKIGIEI